MGSKLSVPLETKLVTQCTNPNFEITAVEMHGARTSMEDECTIQPNVHPDRHLVVVWDGHGGTAASRFAKSKFGELLGAMSPPLTPDKVSLALMGLDIMFADAYPGDRSGSTVAGVLFGSFDDALVFHAGDSRVVIFDVDTGAMIYETSDHKPNVPQEKQRILSAG